MDISKEGLFLVLNILIFFSFVVNFAIIGSRHMDTIHKENNLRLQIVRSDFVRKGKEFNDTIPDKYGKAKQKYRSWLFKMGMVGSIIVGSTTFSLIIFIESILK